MTTKDALKAIEEEVLWADKAQDTLRLILKQLDNERANYDGESRPSAATAAMMHNIEALVLTRWRMGPD